MLTEGFKKVPRGHRWLICLVLAFGVMSCEDVPEPHTATPDMIEEMENEIGAAGDPAPEESPDSAAMFARVSGSATGPARDAALHDYFHALGDLLIAAADSGGSAALDTLPDASGGVR